MTEPLPKQEMHDFVDTFIEHIGEKQDAAYLHEMIDRPGEREKMPELWNHFVEIIDESFCGCGAEMRGEPIPGVCQGCM